MAGRRLIQEQALPTGSPLEQCQAAIDYTRAKADKNKSRSRLCTWTMTIGTASIPVFILASTQVWSFWLGKFVPAAIAAGLFVAASYVQVERPHERWNVYRSFQRKLEAERLLFEAGAGRYADPRAREASLAERVAELTLQLHDEWSRVLPTPDEVAGIGRGHAGA